MCIDSVCVVKYPNIFQVDLFNSLVCWLSIAMTNSVWMGLADIFILACSYSFYVKLQKFFIMIENSIKAIPYTGMFLVSSISFFMHTLHCLKQIKPTEVMGNFDFMH